MSDTQQNAEQRRIADDAEFALSTMQLNMRHTFEISHETGGDFKTTPVEVLRSDLIATLRENLALRAFKSYIHRRLDEANVPTHPDGPHSREGCRVGDRLDIALRAAAKPAALDGDAEQRIAEIAAQAEKATPPPWTSQARAGDFFAIVADEQGDRICSVDGPWPTMGQKAHADFIAASREDIPWLLEQLSALRAANAKQEQRWIPCSEKMPPDGEWVYAWDASYGEYESMLWEDGKFTDVHEKRRRRVTHWRMPLEDPPVVSSEPSP